MNLLKIIAVIALVIIVFIIGAGSVFLFFQRGNAVPESVYMIESSDTIRHMAGASETFLDRDSLNSFLLVQVIQQNYEALDKLQPPLSKLISHTSLLRQLKPCDSAATLLTQNVVDQPLDGLGEGYEQLGRCLKAVAAAQSALGQP